MSTKGDGANLRSKGRAMSAVFERATSFYRTQNGFWHLPLKFLKVRSPRDFEWCRKDVQQIHLPALHSAARGNVV